MHGLKYLASLITQEDGVGVFLKLNANKEWFLGEDREVYELFLNHVTKFGALPGAEALKGIELPQTTETPEYYLDKLKSRYLHITLSKGIKEAVNYLNENNQHEALDKLQSSVVECFTSGNMTRIMDYSTEGHSMIIGNISAMKSGKLAKVRTGWESVDFTTNGLNAGDVLTIVGRPANGKTFLLLWSALNAWEKQGKVPLFFSMEMNRLAISERLAAIQLPINLNQIKTGELSTAKYKNLNESLLKNKSKHPFWVVDGALTATVEDVITYSQYLRPDVVYIDGAYLLWTRENLPRWERVTKSLEMIKGHVAETLGIPVLISYQLNREASKKAKKGETPSLEDIGYTDAVGQISSVVLGLLEDENAKTLKRRQVNILKGRDGQSKLFHINWQFEPHVGLDFSEIEDVAKLETLSYVA